MVDRADKTNKLDKSDNEQAFAVAIIAREKHAVLVQWIGQDGALHRASINDKFLQPDNSVKESDLANGTKYGLDFSEALPDVTSTEIAIALHNGGFWTAEDVRANPTGARNTAYQALQGVYKALFDFISDK